MRLHRRPRLHHTQSTSEDDELKVDENVDDSIFEQDKLIKNSSSGVIHVLTTDDRLTCGWGVPVRYSILIGIPEQGKFCSGCF